MSAKTEVEETKAVETKAAEPKAVVAKVAKKTVESPVSYIGPSIPGKMVANTTFNNGLPESAKKIIEENPFMKQLFVSIDAIADARKEMSVKDSALNILYNKAKNIK